MHMLLCANFGYKYILSKTWTVSLFFLTHYIITHGGYTVDDSHMPLFEPICTMWKESYGGGSGIHLLFGQSSETKCESILAVHAPAQSFCISPRHFSGPVYGLTDASPLAAFLSSSISSYWFCLGFSETLHCCCPSVRSFYSDMTLKAHFNLSSASQIGIFFISLIHFLFLHKHICSSEWAGIVVFLKKGMLSFNQAHYSCPMVQSFLCLSKRTGE